MNPQMRKEYDRLAQYLSTVCAGRRVYYFSNHGNWGDALIREGALNFLVDYGVKYQEVFPGRSYSLQARLTGGVMIYGGSGAWSQGYRCARENCLRFKRRFKIIVLPSTFDNPVRIPGISFCRRDETISARAMPGAHFCHDMAFYLETKSYNFNKGSGVGYFFRTDREAADRRIDNIMSNTDISTHGDNYTPASGFFESITQFEEIRTDRLHVAIAAAILKKKVNLYSGVYEKNLSIYESTLKKFYPNVSWKGNNFSDISC